MNHYNNLIRSEGWNLCPSACKYCEIGTLYCIHDEFIDALYWNYETEHFIINIHDYFIKKEILCNTIPDIHYADSFYSAYLISANGESFDPYQVLTPNTMFVTYMKYRKFRFIMHSNCPYLSVGVMFKPKAFEDYILHSKEIKNIDITEMFFETRTLVTNRLEKIARSILNCNMASPAAEMFFEAKAKEWLSIIIDSYINKSKIKPMSKSDEKALENVANYINDHYALDIHQDILEKIAMMSGTKLKNLFKQKYRMSITQYTQHRRMNMAETLLLTTNLEIKDIAKAVGYNSHSKFSTYYKKYKGLYPREVKKMNSEHYNLLSTCKTGMS